jgi:hypothetical protein
LPEVGSCQGDGQGAQQSAQYRFRQPGLQTCTEVAADQAA